MDDALAALQALRRDLHHHPDLSGDEGETAARLFQILATTRPSRIMQGLGGHGLAAVFESGQSGPTILLRAELDALPIQEQNAVVHRSSRDGVAHLCGHDGHMAILVGIARYLQISPPPTGRVVLLFQPAEETGTGGRAVLADPRFVDLRPDWAFAMHNMPGLPLGALAVAAGPASCASVGVKLRWHGIEAHAAFPETGRSPAPALSALLDWLTPLTHVPPMGPAFQLATLCHLTMGAPAYGIAPAQAEAWITLRALSDDALALLENEVTKHAAYLAARFDLHLSATRHDHFNATINASDAANIVVQAAKVAAIARTDFAFPMRPSEDFGAFSSQTQTALFFMGAGEDCAPLHNPRYDFPDTLIAPACAVFQAILAQIWDKAPD
jgi:amidohydrolase